MTSLSRAAWTLWVVGYASQAWKRSHEALTTAAYGATGAEAGQPHLPAPLSEAYGKSGQVDEGPRALPEAQATAHNTGERDHEPELLLRQDVLAEPQAASCFQQGLVHARRQQGKALELRAALSLSRPWQCQGKGREARQWLAAIHGWCTRGFDITDL